MKEHVLEKADHHVRGRNRQFNLLRPYKTSTHRENDQGDFCCVHADILKFREAKSARVAYDALMFTMANMEISFSEKLDVVNVREEDGPLKDGVGNFRLRSWEHPTAPYESNSVLFTHFYEKQPYSESSDGEGYGVTVIDFVDEDDLYPYQSDQSTRRDISSVYVISTQRKLVRNALTGDVDEELVVVIQRAAFLKVHHSDLVHDESVLDALREEAVTGCDIILNDMREFVIAARNNLTLIPESMSDC